MAHYVSYTLQELQVLPSIACKLYYDSDKKIHLDSKNHKQKNLTVRSENNILENKNQIYHRDGASINSLQIIDATEDQETITKRILQIVKERRLV